MGKRNKITPKKKQIQHVEHVRKEVSDLCKLAKYYGLKFVEKNNSEIGVKYSDFVQFEYHDISNYGDMLSKTVDLRNINPSFQQYDEEQAKYVIQLSGALKAMSFYDILSFAPEDITDILSSLDITGIGIFVHLSLSYLHEKEDLYEIMSILEQNITDCNTKMSKGDIVKFREYADYQYKEIEKRFKFENILEKHGDQIEESQKELMGKGQQEEDEQEDVDLG
jgi:hypothetical protein